jgi:hypothetical protein
MGRDDQRSCDVTAAYHATDQCTPVGADFSGDRIVRPAPDGGWGAGVECLPVRTEVDAVIEIRLRDQHARGLDTAIRAWGVLADAPAILDNQEAAPGIGDDAARLREVAGHFDCRPSAG